MADFVGFNLQLPMIPELSPFRINPTFERHPNEARWIGRILAAFGEIEITTCMLAAASLKKPDQVLRALYRIRMTSARLAAADGLARPEFKALGLLDDYIELNTMVTRCLAIRNRYAHCNWGDHTIAGLFFTDLQDAADAHEGFHFDMSWRHIDCDLLEWQYAYFAFTMDWNRYLEGELGTRQEVIPPPLRWSRPPIPVPPPAHSAPEKHIPLWLSEDRQAQYEAHVRAIAEGRPAPTPGERAMEENRKKRRAEKAAHRERSAEGRKKS
ncbi:hypothetical protein SAMN02990966_05949 [Rhodospirillales bacterium URHD0017]|nr:hypothetical protein SAMN02990966_05949 [Rhodospirillales bacterium URHD0017]